MGRKDIKVIAGDFIDGSPPAVFDTAVGIGMFLQLKSERHPWVGETLDILQIANIEQATPDNVRPVVERLGWSAGVDVMFGAGGLLTPNVEGRSAFVAHFTDGRVLVGSTSQETFGVMQSAMLNRASIAAQTERRRARQEDSDAKMDRIDLPATHFRSMAVLVAALMIMAAGGYAVSRLLEPPTAATGQRAQTEPSSSPSRKLLAHRECAKYIRNASGIPITDIKETPDFGRGNEFYFAWPTGHLPGRNSASCIGTYEPLDVMYVTLNAKDLK